MTEKLTFPDGFLWGTTAANQCEGAYDADNAGWPAVDVAIDEDRMAIIT